MGLNKSKFGTITYDGDVYVGYYMNGKPHGKGVLTQPGGYGCDGDWIEGKCTGHGSYRYPSGSVYVGDFVNDKRHGKGGIRPKSTFWGVSGSQET